jgi:hypothetical protein
MGFRWEAEMSTADAKKQAESRGFLGGVGLEGEGVTTMLRITR